MYGIVELNRVFTMSCSSPPLTFTIITPTTGHPKLAPLLHSINAQTCPVEHFLVVDGPQFSDSVNAILQEIPANESRVTRRLFYLPINTGGGGFLGHKIYAGITQFVTTDYVLYLDEDNWLEDTHVASCLETLTKQTPPLDWCFSLRTIRSHADGAFICNDDCESLGHLHPSFYSGTEHMIDTNCMCVSRHLAIQFSPIWNHVGTNSSDNPDRVYSQLLMTNFQAYDCTLQHTVHYRVANRAESVNGDMFLAGNAHIRRLHGGKIPWTDVSGTAAVVALAHFDPQHTSQIIHRIYQAEKEQVAYHQWQLNLLDACDDIIWLNAYQKYLPANSKVLVHMCSPHTLPRCVVHRQDLQTVLYTAEGPNIRHREQWSEEFLRKHFTQVLTYWGNDMLAKCFSHPSAIVYTPFVHRFRQKDMELYLRPVAKPAAAGKSVGMVLENRPIQGKYSLLGQDLYALDFLRKEYAVRLGKSRISCHGATWEGLQNEVNYCPAKPRYLDEEFVVDILQKYRFALIIENCTADGYVSEKIYDAWAAGCIPLYYGNVNERMGIPSACYVDLKTIAPDALPEWLDNLSESQIAEYEVAIEKYREEILNRVSVDAYGALIKKVTKVF